MKTEKVSQEKVARTIQQMKSKGGIAQFMDNRSSTVMQWMAEQPLVQRAGMDDEEDAVQGKFTESIQREEDDEGMQMKAKPSVQKKPNITGLPDNLKAGVEHLSGFSLDNVKVHYNSPQPATVQALAYTQGTDIHVGPGQEQHLPHEAWHVAQQMEGRVAPTTEIGGMPVNDNADLEHEADVMGAKANSFV